MAGIVLDEDVHKSLAATLADAGHDVVRVQEAGLAGASDNDVFDFAQSRKSVLITCDLGIADARVLMKEPHAGVILLRMPNEMTTRRVDEEVGALLAQVPIEAMENMLVVIEPGSVRLRRTDQ